MQKNIDQLRLSIENFEIPVENIMFNMKSILVQKELIEKTFKRLSLEIETQYKKLISQFGPYFKSMIPVFKVHYKKSKCQLKKAKKKHLSKLIDEAEKLQLIFKIKDKFKIEWSYLAREPNLRDDQLNQLESDVKKAIKHFESVKLLATNLFENIEFKPSNDISLGNIVFFQTRYYQNGYFEGEIIDGKRNGKGTFYFYNDSDMKSEGKRIKHNFDSQRSKSEWRIEGMWKNDRLHGDCSRFQNNHAIEIMKWKHGMQVNV
jgi:hypothetical protein